MKKALSSIELRNYFPSWSEIRTSWQSIGAQYLNTLGVQMDDMDVYLEKMKHNAFLSTVNLDEVDWVYKVQLPTTYSFTLDTTDSMQPTYSAPTVVGTVDGVDYDVELADDNSLEHMGYDFVPSRATYEETEDGDDELLHWPATSFPFSGELTHHISDGGRLWIEMQSGTQYVSINDDGKVDRGVIKLTGTTRKGTKETETLVFPWDMKQPTQKEWKSIVAVDVDNLEDTVSVEIRSANYAWGPYQSFYNLRFSESDRKVDEFWDLGDSNTALDRVGYISDSWEDLMLGFSSTETKDRWELLDTDLSTITATDIAIQPFQDRAWAVDGSNLYCFSLDEVMVSGVDFLAKRSPDSHFQIEQSDQYYVAGDTIGFTPLHIRPTGRITKYRIWYQDPTGTQYGLDQGSQVAFTADFWQYPTQLKRQLEGEIFISTAQRGEYKIALDVYYADGTVHNERLIIPVQYKQPLAKIDISPYISGTVEGLDFDSDQHLWVKTDAGHYRFSLHADLMIVDYEDKVVYFREDYDEVDIT